MLSFASLKKKYGAPSSTNVTFTVVAAGTVDIDVQYQKRPTRMAESVWLSFRPVVADPHQWRYVILFLTAASVLACSLLDAPPPSSPN
jgi:hypothetical protein